MNYAEFHEAKRPRWGGWLWVGALHVGVAALLMGQKMVVSKPPPTTVSVHKDERQVTPPEEPKPQVVDLSVRSPIQPPAVPDWVIRSEPQPPIGPTEDRRGTEGPPAVSGPAGGALAGAEAGGGRPPAVAAASITVACPHQVAPEMPARASQKGVSGTVRALLTVRDGRVAQVEILQAQPRGYFEAAVRSAALQYRCVQQGSQAVVAEQVFQFTAGD